MASDRIYPLKRERVSSGGGQNDVRETIMNSLEDTIPLYKELLIVDDETDLSGIINQGLKVDVDHEIVLFDRVTGEKKLSDLIGGSVINTFQNKVLSENTGDVYSTRDNITFPSRKAGSYLISYTFHYGLDSSDYDFIYDLLINDASEHSNTLLVSDSLQKYLPITSFCVYNLVSDGDINIKLNYKSSYTACTSMINFSSFVIQGL